MVLHKKNSVPLSSLKNSVKERADRWWVRAAARGYTVSGARSPLIWVMDPLRSGMTLFTQSFANTGSAAWLYVGPVCATRDLMQPGRTSIIGGFRPLP